MCTRPIALLLPALLLTACNRDVVTPAPPRVDTALPVPALTSIIAVPVSASLDDLEQALNRDTPETLWSIDERIEKCIPGQRVTIKFLGVDKRRITPDIPCHVTGSAERGRIRATGAGEVLTLTMPVSAAVTAEDTGGDLIRKTATAEALVTARVRLGITPDWSPAAKVDLDYRWRQEPGVDVLGRRLRLTSRADPRLQSLVRRLEADIPRHLARLHTREALARNWARAFTTIELNRQNPEVWLRIAPEAVHVSPWTIAGRTVTLPLAVRASAETIIGHRPDNPVPTPLPPPAPPVTGQSVQLHLPIVADYAVLEPVLAKALAKLSRKGMKIEDFGIFDVRFTKVSIYPTTGGRIAVGLQIYAKSPREMINARGTLWLAGTPYNAPGSQRVAIKDLVVASRTDSQAFDLLVAIAEDPAVKATIADALTQDFSKDLAKLMAKIEPKLAALPLGPDFTLSAKVTRFKNGRVSALGQGLFMPVQAEARATLQYHPAPATGPKPAKIASGPPLKTPPARP